MTARVALRMAAFGALGLFGAERWAAMLSPVPSGRAWLIAALGVAGGLALVAAGRLPARARVPAALGIALALFVLALIVAGVSPGLLRPRRWDELAGEVAAALGALPQVAIPYTGSDAWVTRVILVGAPLLLGAAALAAFWPRRTGTGRPLVAAVLLVVLAGVPAVVLPGGAATRTGAVLFVLLVAFLALERLAAADAPVAGGLTAAAALVAILLFPALDRPGPWFDYEAAAESLAPHPVSFDWKTGFGPLDWPRSGRELFRARGPRGLYWKAESLDAFDGLHWRAVREGRFDATEAENDLARRTIAHPEWVHTIAVTVRGLRSGLVVGAGETLGVADLERGASTGASPGTWTADSDLREGDSYRARVYMPAPSPGELEAAGESYPDYLTVDRAVTLPPAAVARPGARGRAAQAALGRGEAPTVVPPSWGRGGTSVVYAAGGVPSAGDAAGLIRRSVYARAWRLADRLRAGAADPYQYAQRISAYLSGNGFRYSEAPSPATVPLEHFLFVDRKGYCQYFAGAMALLLRMGGVPARVAAGFAPGTIDPDTGEWIVRDEDAHVWVEAYFPGIGWATFDPTPAVSPARGQVTANRAPEVDAGTRAGVAGLNKDLRLPNARRTGGARGIGGSPDGGSVPVLPIVLGALGLTALAALVLLRRRRRHEPRPDERVVAELERALRRAGRPPAARTTLRDLEERFRASSDAAGYVRAVRALRYEGGVAGPSAAQRRALRRELARGLGPVGTLRAWWALPPLPGARVPDGRNGATPTGAAMR